MCLIVRVFLSSFPATGLYRGILEDISELTTMVNIQHKHRTTVATYGLSIARGTITRVRMCFEDSMQVRMRGTR